MEQVYDNFDGMSDTDKEYFLRKSHELEIKKCLLKKQSEKEKSTIEIRSLWAIQMIQKFLLKYIFTLQSFDKYISEFTLYL